MVFSSQRRLPERGEKEWIVTLEESSISLKCPLGSGDLIFVNLVTKLSFWLRNLCEELEMILFKLTSGQAACQSQMKIMRWLKKAHVACSLFFFFSICIYIFTDSRSTPNLPRWLCFNLMNPLSNITVYQIFTKRCWNNKEEILIKCRHELTI